MCLTRRGLSKEYKYFVDTSTPFFFFQQLMLLPAQALAVGLFHAIP